MATKPASKEKPAEQGQARLTEPAELVQALIRSAGTGIYIAQKGKFIYVSPLFQGLLGYTEKELIGTHSLDLVHPEDRELVRKKAIESLKGESSTPYEYRCIKRNGDIMWILERVTSTEYTGKQVTIGSFMDITERKQAEEGLRVSEEKLRMQYKGIPVPTYTWQKAGEDLILIGHNEAAMAITHGNITNFVGKTATEMYHDRPEILDDLHRCFNEKTQMKKEMWYHFASTEEEKYLVVSYVFVSPDLVLVHTEDITERQQAQEALRGLEKRYRLLFEQAGDSIIVVDVDTGEMMDFNDRAYQSLGYSRDEFARLRIPDFEVIESEGEVARHIRRIGKEGAASFETKHRTKSGNIRDVEVTSRVVSVGGRNFVQSILRDITERKLTEEALRQSEERYRTILEEMEDCYWEVELAGNLTFVNDSTCHTLGYSREELMGMNYRGYIAEEDAEARYHALNQVYRTGQPARGFSWKMLRKDGSTAFAEASAFPLRDREGEIIGFRGIANDVTERTQAEEERERLLNNLADKTRELEQIVYVTSHDLQSPLVNVQGFTTELVHACEQIRSLLNSEQISPTTRQKLTSIIDEDIPKHFGYILRSTSKMDWLLSGILQLSRLGCAELAIKPLDMNGLMSDVVAAFKFQANEAGATLEVQQLPPCLGDERQIDQLFSNLVSNALKYLEPNRPGVIRVSGRKEKGQAVYCVEDNGVGIAQEHQKNIFEIFHRLDPGFKSGDGLGLTIVQRILRRHDGKIWVESEPGKGSKFLLTLPAVKARPRKKCEVTKHAG